MNLVLDIGNTNTKLAIFENNKMIDNQIVQVLSLDYLKKIMLRYPGISNLCFSNTSSPVNYIQDLCVECKVKYLNVSYKDKLPIIIKYKTPDTLGPDRIALAIGASIKYPGNSLVIDLGTCITYDIILENIYLGGQISPGLTMRLSALNHYTHNLPKINFKKPNIDIGQNTQDSILVGVYEGIISEINSIIEKYKARYSNINIILTGGDKEIFKEKLQNINFIDSYLLMHGLNYIIASNESL